MAADDQEVVWPGHWSYRVLQDLAEQGALPGERPETFQGARVLNRAEIGRLAATAQERVRGDPTLLDASGRQALEDLARSFPPPATSAHFPLRAQGDPSASQRRGLARWGLRGNQFLRVARREGQGNDSVQDRLGLTWQHEGWLVTATGEASNRDHTNLDRRVGDVFVGEDQTFLLQERYLIWRRKPSSPSLVQAGDINNFVLGKGLVLGGAAFDGGRGHGEAGAWRVDGLGGETRDHRRLAGAQVGLEGEGRGGRRAGARLQFLTLEQTPRLDEALGGLEGKLEPTRSWTFEGAGVLRERAGQGIWSQARWRGSAWKLRGEWRDYDDLEVDVNNAPVYSGPSGGDDVDSRGGALESGWKPLEDLEATGRLDHSRAYDARDQALNHMARLQWACTRALDLTLQGDYEAARRNITKVGLLRLEFKGQRERRWLVDLESDEDRSERLRSLRNQVVWPLARRWSVTVGHLLRRSQSETRNEGSLRLNWRPAEGHNLSGSLRAADREPQETEASLAYILRF